MRMSDSKNKKPERTYRNVIIRPFSYITSSVGMEMFLTLAFLGVQIILLVLSNSFSAVAVICAATAGSVCAAVSAEHFSELNRPRYFSYPICIAQGIITGMLLPETYPPLTVFLAVLLTMIIIKYFFGGFSYSLVNPCVFAAAVLWLIGAHLFGKAALTADMLAVRNPSQLLIESGLFPAADFDAPVTSSLNSTVFSLLNVSVPEGYVSLFWDSRSIIPAFRFNVITIISAAVLFAADKMKLVVSACFLAVYLLFVRFLSPVFFHGIPLQGDMLLALLTGGTLFTAVFVLNWYGTVPESLCGKSIYGILAGAAAFFISGCGTSPAGMIFTVLLVNFASVFIQFFERKADISRVHRLAEQMTKDKDF